MKKKIVLWASLLLINAAGIFAQLDSLQQLKEVVVCGEPNDQQFNYYRSSRLATTEEVMQRMQGLNMIRRGAYGFEPTLRNYSANQITLTLGGMRMYGACTDKMDPVSIYVEPANLQQISLKHGNNGMFMGSSTGGNIDLAFRMPDNFCHKGTQINFNQLYQSNNHGYAATLALEHQTGKLGLRATGTFRNAGNYTTGEDSLVNHSYFKKYNASLALAYELDSQQQIQIHYLFDEGQDIGYPALPMDVGIATAHILSVAHIFKSKKLEGETKLYHNTIYHSMDDTQRDSVPMHMDMPGWSKTTGFYTQWNYYQEKHLFKIRADAHENYLRADMTMYPNNGDPLMYMQTLPSSYLFNFGLYLGYETKLTKKLFFTLNSRLDGFKQHAAEGIGSQQAAGMGHNITNPITDVLKNVGLNLCYQPNKKQAFTLNFGYAERLPSANERYGFYLFNRIDGYDYLGNPNLTIESARQVEIRYNLSLKNFSAFVQGFLHKQQNYIYPYMLKDYYAMTIGAKGVKTYTNIDRATNLGFETGWQWRFLENWQVNQTSRYIYAQTSWGEPLPLVSPFTIYNSVRTKIKNWQLQADLEWHAAQNRINSDFNERPTPQYGLIHVRSAKLFKIKEHVLQLTFACENVLNNTYWDHLDIGYVPRMGRNFQIGLNFML